MTRTSRFSRPRRADSTDEGFGFIVVVIAIALVMAVLTATLFRVALDNISTSARMVDSNQALQAAESGIDMAYEQVEASSSLSAMPCSATVTGTTLKLTRATGSTSTITDKLGSTPSTSTYTVSFSYFSTLTTQSSPLTCTSANLANARGIRLTATGTDLTETATVQSEANIATPQKTSPFNQSVFVNGALNLQGGGSFVGGNNNIYLNGTLTCRGGAAVDGSVVAFGKVKTGGGCSIAGEVTATTTITIGGSAVIAGTITSTCPPTKCATGISISGNPTVSGSIFAKSAVTIATGTWKTKYLTTAHTVTVGGKPTSVYYTINAYMTGLVTPPKKTFPTYNWTATLWTSSPHTYTVKTTLSCSALSSYLTTTVPVATTRIAIYTSCSVTLPSMKLAHSLAIFSTAGITLKNSHSITASARHTLFLIVPTTANKTCSSSTTVTVRGTTGTTVPTFIYAPCHVKIAGTGTIKSGNVYAGKQLTIDGSITLGSVTPTLPHKISNGGNPVLGIVYERELS
jgi:Tfp pilus assembly protein PilX/cytoskeletal protein CcmA (bactofilin family)